MAMFRTNLSNEVLRLCRGTSDKYVPCPTQSDVQADLLLGLRRFKNSVRWKEFWRNENKRQFSPKGTGKVVFSPSPTVTYRNDETQSSGLGTNLKPVERIKNAPRGSEGLELFLRETERTLLEMAFDSTNERRPANKDNPTTGFRPGCHTNR